jgi:hypothetical protein
MILLTYIKASLRLNLGLLGIYSGNYIILHEKLPEHYIAPQIISLNLINISKYFIKIYGSKSLNLKNQMLKKTIKKLVKVRQLARTISQYRL